MLLHRPKCFSLTILFISIFFKIQKPKSWESSSKKLSRTCTKLLSLAVERPHDPSRKLSTGVRNEGNACQRSLLPCHRLANFFSHKKLIIQIYLKMFKLANEREKDIYRIFTPCSTTRFLFSREIKYIIEECR
jgi:hypothetical protein